jgi:L-amino acid N-acyltransferase YncA
MIREVTLLDANTVCEIYNEYLAKTIITFEEIPVTVEEMMTRIVTITKNYPWLVYEEEGKVVGYIYANKWKERSAYRYSVELGIYIDSKYIGKGIGSKLMKEVLNLLKAKSIHSVIYGVSLPNEASIALCEKFGFKKIGQFEEVGFKFDKWIDVGYWELKLK